MECHPELKHSLLKQRGKFNTNSTLPLTSVNLSCDLMSQLTQQVSPESIKYLEMLIMCDEAY